MKLSYKQHLVQSGEMCYTFHHFEPDHQIMNFNQHVRHSLYSLFTHQLQLFARGMCQARSRQGGGPAVVLEVAHWMVCRHGAQTPRGCLVTTHVFVLT